MRGFAYLGTLLLTVACGGDTTDVRTRSGSVPFSGTTAYFFATIGQIAPPDGGSVRFNLLQIEIHASADGCGPWQGVIPPTRSILSVSLGRPESTPITPDRYPVAASTLLDHAWVQYTHEEPSGGSFLVGVAGEVELGRLSGTAARGSVDVTLQDGTRMAGDFAASPCP